MLGFNSALLCSTPETGFRVDPGTLGLLSSECLLIVSEILCSQHGQLGNGEVEIIDRTLWQGRFQSLLLTVWDPLILVSQFAVRCGDSRLGSS